MIRLAGIALALVVSAGAACAEARIKDITQVQGVRDNQLVGYGVVVGLQGTGDTPAQRAVHRTGVAVHARPHGRQRARRLGLAHAQRRRGHGHGGPAAVHRSRRAARRHRFLCRRRVLAEWAARW
jgi:hypothetical protein